MTWYLLGISIGILFIIIFLGNLHVSFDPFSISLPRWRGALGWICMVLGICFIQWDANKRAVDTIREELNNEWEKFKSETLRES